MKIKPNSYEKAIQNLSRQYSIGVVWFLMLWRIIHNFTFTKSDLTNWIAAFHHGPFSSIVTSFWSYTLVESYIAMKKLWSLLLWGFRLSAGRGKWNVWITLSGLASFRTFSCSHHTRVGVRIAKLRAASNIHFNGDEYSSQRLIVRHGCM